MAGKNRLLAKILGNRGSILPDSDTLAVAQLKNIPSVAGTSVYSNIDDLPSTAVTGEKALITSINTLYLYNSGWYKIALINNFNPQWVTQPSATYDLAINSTPTVITMLATDSDDVPIKYIATTDSDFDSIATVSHDSDKHNVFTIIPTDSENGAATGGTGTITFKATDGVNQVQQVSTFSLTFGPDYASVAQVDELYSEYPETQDYFGNNALTIDGTGSYTAVGAQRATPIPGNASYDNKGKAYVYYSSDLTTWSRSNLIKASDYNQSHHGSFFAENVGLNDSDGSYLVVSASRDSQRTGQGTTAGAVYIYTRSGTNTWTQQQKLLPPNSGSYVRSSNSMGLKGVRLNADATLLFAASSSQTQYGGSNIANSGYVMMFARSGAGFATTATYCFDQPGGSDATGNPATGDEHVGGGFDINSDGTYIATTCHKKHIGSNADQGAVYVFNGSGTSWTTTEILDSGGAANDQFSIGGVALNDDATVLVVGCGYANSYVGELIVYTRSGTTWTQRQTLTHTLTVGYFGGYDGGKNNNFDISGDGEFIVAGAANGSSTSKGTVIFKRGSGTNTWSAVKTLTPLEANSGEGHRSVISNNGEILAVGAGFSTVAEGGGGTGLATTGRVLMYKPG